MKKTMTETETVAISPEGRAMLEEYQRKAQERAKGAREKLLGRLADLAGAAEEAYDGARNGEVYKVDIDPLWRLVNQIADEQTVFLSEHKAARDMRRFLDEQGS